MPTNWTPTKIEALRIKAGRVRGYTDADEKPKAMFQADFAVLIGTREQSVNRWLKGKQKPNPMACALLDAANVKIDREAATVPA